MTSWGLLIQAAVGSAGGAGGLRTNPLGVSGEGGVEHAHAGGVELLGVAVVDCVGGHQPDPAVTMGVVVPVDERSAVWSSPAFLDI